MWEIERSATASPFLIGSQVLGNVDKVHMIDQFRGRLPKLVNAQFLRDGKLDILFRPGILLDSNLVDDIDRRVRGGAVGDGVEQFLRFVLEKQWDVNPLFYCLEHLSKSSPSIFRKNAIRRLASIIRIHVADANIFLSTGELRSDQSLLDGTLMEGGASSIEELAEKRVDNILSGYDAAMLRDMLEASQVALIKMVLIEKQELPKASLQEKLKGFHDFVDAVFGVQMAREAHLAAHYFAGLAGSLLGIQASTPAERAIRTIRATAWDIFLLRFPEGSLRNCLDVNLMYVATKEVQLYELGRLFSLEAVFGDPAGPIPVLAYDLDQIAEPVRDRLAALDIPTRPPTSKRPPSGSPSLLLSAMQSQLGAFCA